jgi:hypothetical protein
MSLVQLRIRSRNALLHACARSLTMPVNLKPTIMHMACPNELNPWLFTSGQVVSGCSGLTLWQGRQPTDL